MKDWKGNTKSIYTTLGASSHSEGDREDNDYYATEPKAVELLLELDNFSEKIWEPACGEGHISEVLKVKGYSVTSSDLINRGYGEVIDFLGANIERWDGDIITNPPYRYAKEFVEKAMSIIDIGQKVAMFLKVTFLESADRKNLFQAYPPKRIYVASKRLKCAKNGKFDEMGSSAACYCWFIWQKGYQGDTSLKWFN